MTSLKLSSLKESRTEYVFILCVEYDFIGFDTVSS